MGHTDNCVTISAPREFVFELTNQLELWTEMFTEYASVEILSRDEREFVFRLTTHPGLDGQVRSWTSWRRLFPSEGRIEAARIEPAFPFTSMRLCWDYEVQGAGTVLRWVQDFVVAPQAPFSELEAESYLNHHSRVQMQAVKCFVERRWQEQQMSHREGKDQEGAR